MVQTKKCPHCDADVDPTLDRCPDCWNVLATKHQTGLKTKLSGDTKRRHHFWLSLLIAVAIIVGFIVLNTPNPFRSKMEFNDARFSENFDASQVKTAVEPVCEELTTLVDSADLNKYSARIRSLSWAQGFSPREALSYSKRKVWVNEMDVASQFEAKYSQIMSGHLEQLIRDSFPKLSQTWVAYQVTNMLSKFQDETSASCYQVSSKISSVLKTLKSYDSKRAEIRLIAATVPWYPSGYSEYSEDSSLAWQWYRTSCNLGDSCWHMKVIAESGCYNGLYGEINILDGSGGIIDYSNDIVPRLGGGQVAVLEFSTYDSSARTGQLARLTCN